VLIGAAVVFLADALAVCFVGDHARMAPERGKDERPYLCRTFFVDKNVDALIRVLPTHRCSRPSSETVLKAMRLVPKKSERR